MYIYIYEDGEIRKAAQIEEDDKASIDAGILDIVDCNTCKAYYDGQWRHLPDVKDPW
jgi:hypothetical protein